MATKVSRKTLSVIAYITIFGLLIAYFLNKEKRSRSIAFHVRQSLGLWVMYFIIGYVIVGWFNSMNITYAFWIFFFVLFIYGIFGAAMGQNNKIPLLGDFFQKIFKSLKY